MGDHHHHHVVFPSNNNNSNRNHKRYIKRTIPALFHTVEAAMERSTWTRPLQIQHNMHRINVTPSLESPLISVCHELEITFQFEHQFEDIKAKIPIILASTPEQEKQQQQRRPSTTSSKLEWDEDEEEKEYDNNNPQGYYAEQQQLRQGVIKDRPLQIPHFRHILASSSSAVKHSLDEDRLGINNSRIGDCRRVPRKSPSASDLTSHHQHEPKYGDHEHEYDQEVYQSHHQMQLPIKHKQRRKHSLQPINVDLANCTYSNNHPTKASTTMKQTTTKNKNRMQLGEDHMTLHTRPPSMVYSNAPGLPAATELRPQEATPTSLLEESFISDVDDHFKRGDRSPDLATIASSTLLSSPRTVVFTTTTTTTTPDQKAFLNTTMDNEKEEEEDSNKENKGGRHKSFGMPAPPPPPQTPLPPIPLDIVVAKQKEGHHRHGKKNSTFSRTRQRQYDDDRRKTKLYIEDSDEEAVV